MSKMTYQKDNCMTQPLCSSWKNEDIEGKNTNSQICADCQGECCKKSGGIFSPNDFKEISFGYLKQEIEKGYISIDYIGAVEGNYILRMRNIDSNLYDMGGHAPCVQLSENGCKLQYEERPAECRLTIPSAYKYKTLFVSTIKRMCEQKYTSNQAAYEWEPYQTILQQLIDFFEGKKS